MLLKIVKNTNPNISQKETPCFRCMVFPSTIQNTLTYIYFKIARFEQSDLIFDFKTDDKT